MYSNIFKLESVEYILTCPDITSSQYNVKLRMII